MSNNRNNNSKKEYLESIECSAQPLDFAFHPKKENILAAALVDGTLEVHDIRVGDDDDDEEEPDSILSSVALHTKLLPVKNLGGGERSNNNNNNKPMLESCRAVAFSSSDGGNRIYTGGSAGGLCAVDAERVCTFSTQKQKPLLWRIEPATITEGQQKQPNPLVVIKPFENSSSLVATGDDHGGVRLWDERMCGNNNNNNNNNNAGNNLKKPNGCVLQWKENEDYISGLEHSQDGNTLLATSADGRLAVFDLRMAREAITKNNGQEKQFFRLSDDQEDELLSLQIMKHGKKVVCGTQEGVLSVFSWGTWGDCSDRFPGHPSSIDALLKIDEETLLTGSSDGLIRVVQIQPDKLLGVLGDNHEGFPIEKLGFNANKDLVGSVCHDNYIRLWDARVLHDGYDDDDDGDSDKNDDDDDDKMQVEEQKQKQTTAKKPTKGNGSDDEWEDMDEDDSDSDDDDSDSDDSNKKPATANDKRKERLKTDNEKFFDDL